MVRRAKTIIEIGEKKIYRIIIHEKSPDDKKSITSKSLVVYDYTEKITIDDVKSCMAQALRKRFCIGGTKNEKTKM